MTMKLELVPIPVTDVDRAKAFYADQVGFHVDLDERFGESLRVVQLNGRPGPLPTGGLPTRRDTAQDFENPLASSAWQRGLFKST